MSFEPSMITDCKHEYISEHIPGEWHDLMKDEYELPYFLEWCKFLKDRENKGMTVYPPLKQMFRSLELVKIDDIRMPFIFQDPYIRPKQAHGVALSIADPSVATPPSLFNFFAEMKADLLTELKDVPESYWKDNRKNNLEYLLNQGAFFYNVQPTTDANDSDAHKKCGGEIFSNAIFMQILKRLKQKQKQVNAPQELYFVCCGKTAFEFVEGLLTEFDAVNLQEKNENECKRTLAADSTGLAKGTVLYKSQAGHSVFRCTHPSPFSARSPSWDTQNKIIVPAFMGSHLFSRANLWLHQRGLKGITWINLDLARQLAEDLEKKQNKKAASLILHRPTLCESSKPVTETEVDRDSQQTSAKRIKQ